jgi:hypothetical protein
MVGKKKGGKDKPLGTGPGKAAPKIPYYLSINFLKSFRHGRFYVLMSCWVNSAESARADFLSYYSAATCSTSF